MNNLSYKRKIKNINFRLYPALIVFIVFIISTVYFSIKIASMGDKLTILENEKTKVLQENRDFSLNIVKSTSLSLLSGESQSLGFVLPEKILYLKAEESVAKLP